MPGTSFSRPATAFSSLLLAAQLLGCNAASTVASESPIAASTVPAQYRATAFILDISTLRRTVRVTAPTAGLFSTFARLAPIAVNEAAQQSLLGADVVDVTSSNVRAGAIGAVQPGKIHITFDLRISNRLRGIRLITPTFPTPPAGVTGLQAFPFEISVIRTGGGVGTIGNEIIVSSPRFGAVVPSNEWNGAPHSFFNDTQCGAVSNDCFRYEPFGMIGPLGVSEIRQVGFLVDPTVGDFRVKVILAADIQTALDDR